jgi:hypothetical protein
MSTSYAHESRMNPEVKPKAKSSLQAIHIHPSMHGDGHVVMTHQFGGGAESKEFTGPHAAVTLPAGHILSHVAEHLGIPTAKADIDKAEETEDTEA